MKTQILVAITALGMALAAPVSAHDNSPWGEDGIEIGDMQGNHEYAIDELSNGIDGMPSDVAMDPSDGNMDLTTMDPQPNGVNIPDSDDVLGPVNGASTPLR
jgi:hypothetical protein